MDIIETRIPSLITSFNSFVEFREIQKRCERVNQKLKSIGFASPALERRYWFHKTYYEIVRRNRLHQRLDLRDIRVNQALSFIAAVCEATKRLSGSGKSRLRSRILDALSPDRNFRELEHEMRVFIHYTRAGFDVIFSELEDAHNFDYLVKNATMEFEVECKTFGEQLGNPISQDESYLIFAALKNALDKYKSDEGSGILRLTLHDRLEMSRKELDFALNDFLKSSPAQKDYETLSLQFEKKETWEPWVREKNRERIAEEMIAYKETVNQHAMMAIYKNRAILCCAFSKRRSKPALGIVRRLKEASEQFSKQRPSVIWSHFLGVTEEEFSELSNPDESRARIVFGSLAHQFFRSENRKHVCRLRLSVDSDSVRMAGYSLMGGNQAPKLTTSGPAYDLTSRNSTYDSEATTA